jgi:hypothetical protein
VCVCVYVLDETLMVSIAYLTLLPYNDADGYVLLYLVIPFLVCCFSMRSHNQ